MLKLKLIPEWREAWRFHTVIIAAILGLLNWIVVHPDFLTPELAAALATVLPPSVMGAVNRWVPLLLIIARLVKQQIPARGAVPAPAVPVPSPGVSP